MLWNFFIAVSMENILQSLVKIIIIGSLYKTNSVNCNRQFLHPPLPYYPNGNVFVPGFAPPYQEPVPVYYREENPPPPLIPFQSPYTPQQLFHRNENYNPLQFANPSVRYSHPQIIPYEPIFNQPFKTQSNTISGVGQFNLNKPAQVPAKSQNRPAEVTKKKPGFYGSNIIIKEESQPPYYNDDYNKNYHDEDYADNYSDESPPQPEPCVLDSPYRYFEPPKPDPNNPNLVDKYTLCSSYFQPNFGNGVYTVKMPITLLPSRFPPRVEQLIERIQNYFSTYTQQETLKPENQTLTTTTPSPEILENEVKLNVTENLNKKNSTEEIEKPNFEQTNLNPSEEVAVVEGNEQVTQKTIVVTIPEEEIPSTPAPDVQDQKKPQLVNESNETTVIAVIETTPTEAIFAFKGEFPVSEQQPKVDAKAQEPTAVNVPENQNLQETPVHIMGVNELENTTESEVMNNRTEEVFTLKEGLLQVNVTDSNG